MDNICSQYNIPESRMRTLQVHLITLSFIILAAVLIRFYHLGSVPQGMTWDEAAIGYNGYSILTTRRDEWLERLPVSFRSFGDYKAPLAIYINGIFTFLFGLNLFAVRLPFAISGSVAIVIMSVLIKKIFQDSPHSTMYGLIGGAFLAFSPWHIHYSRIGFESGLSLTLVLIFTYLFISIFDIKSKTHTSTSILIQNIQQLHNKLSKFIKRIPFIHRAISKNNFKISTAMLSVVCSLFLASSLYAYHSAKIVVPLLLALLAYYYLEGLKKFKMYFLIFILACVLFLYPLVNDAIYGKGLERAGVNVFSSMSLDHAIITSVTQFGMHFNPDFLIFGETKDLRHGDGKWGVLYVSDLLIISLGMLLFIYSIITKKLALLYKTYSFGLLWTLIAVIPASITQDAPHSNRALLALPGFVIIFICSLDALYKYVMTIKGTIGKKEIKNIILKMSIGILILLHGFFTISYLNDYFNLYAKTSAHAFSEGYIEAFEIAEEYEKGLNGKRRVQRILFTTEYKQPYIFALFVRKTKPISYHGGSLIDYEFTNKITQSDLERDNVLIVAGRSSKLDEDKAMHIVKDSSGKVRFKIYLTEDK